MWTEEHTPVPFIADIWWSYRK